MSDLSDNGFKYPQFRLQNWTIACINLNYCRVYPYSYLIILRVLGSIFLGEFTGESESSWSVGSHFNVFGGVFCWIFWDILWLWFEEVQLCFYIIENPPTGSPLNMEDTKKTPRQVFSSGTRYIATKCDFAPMTDGDDVIPMTSR